MNSINSSPYSSAKPKLEKNVGIVTGFFLITWGLFTVGIQVYILAAYSSFDYGFLGQAWTDAYNGMAIASGATNILLGSVTIAVFSSKQLTITRNLLMIGVNLIGACSSVASLVLTALQSDWLNYPRQIQDAPRHPCGNRTINNQLTPEICTNWLALELTVSILSGLAFCSYLIIIYELALDLKGHSRTAKHQLTTTSANQKASPTKNQNNEIFFTATKPPSDFMSGIDEPYNAYGSIDENLNPKYKDHLHQISLQQRAIDEMLATTAANKRYETMNSNFARINNGPPSTPVVLSSSVSVSSRTGQPHISNQELYKPEQYPTNSLRTPKASKPIPIPLPPSGQSNNLNQTFYISGY